MNLPSPPDLITRLQAAGPALGAIAPGRLAPTLDEALATRLELDRATRDRLVIFDPSSAPLIRPLVTAADLRPWRAAAAGRWIVAVPADRAADLAARHPALARHLAELEPPPAHAGAEPWWALPPALAAPAASPRLIVGTTVAWDESAALVGGPGTLVAPAEPYWLALLGSRLGAALLTSLDVAAFPVPAAEGPARANLEGLALAAAELAAQIDELERAVLRRLVADFGPPGVAPGPELRRWWELSFEQLHAAVLGELRNDIPERFRPVWAEIHADQRATHAEARTRLGGLQAAVDAQVVALFGLSGDEARLVGGR
jgi:hypothetical protein